jgi:hypothetical protein
MPAFPERSGSGSKKQTFPRTESVPDPLNSNAAGATQDDLLTRYGITSVPTMRYEWGGFRYTNAHDAIAAAKRGASR